MSVVRPAPARILFVRRGRGEYKQGLSFEATVQNSRPTQNKRARERAIERQREAERRQTKLRRARRLRRDEDPDIAGIVPGPQPNPWGDLAPDDTEE
jgi:hypothetical protein